VSNLKTPFQREQADLLSKRLEEPRRFLQVGKTTLVNQVTRGQPLPVRFVSADEPTLRDQIWLRQQWEAARLEAAGSGGILVVDEIQKVEQWSETVKQLWDEDSRKDCPLKVVLLGSAPLLLQRGLTESLAGRFETIHLPHWSLAEMEAAFGYQLEDYLYFGGYPGAAPLRDDPVRWRSYLLDSLIETSVSRDILLLTRVDKPALLRRLFELGCRYSGQILSYTKMLGQLQDAGNTVTLELLGAAGLLTGLPKFAGETVRQRASSPKLQVLNTALMSAMEGLSPEESRKDRSFYGRLVESAVGAHLANAARVEGLELFYWRDRNREVDFVVRKNRKLTAIEVKSGLRRDCLPGMSAFVAAYQPTRCLLIGGDGIPLEDFLRKPASHWLGSFDG